MPFDNTLPADHAPVVSSELRNQLNGLADQIATKASNCDAVVPLNIPFHDPPTRDEIQAVNDKLTETINALHS